MTNIEELKQALGDLDEEKVQKLLNEFVAGNPNDEATSLVVNACQQGMAVVGELFEKGDYFIGDLIFAGELLTAALDTLKPVMGGNNGAGIGKMVIGTVDGDLHDIGKNIFKSMAEAAGFEVYDLGVDQPPEAFVEKVKVVQPQIVGMSGVLTLALDSMKSTVDALRKAGLRDNVKIIIGGNPVTEEACRQIGADAYTVNAAEGVRIVQGWVS